MQFKHPEILYALLLLLIPIIVHLFQLRRFQKIAFTNVAFLKKATLQTRKSARIKKWLTLFTRLLLLSCIIMAFAQPFSASKKALNTEKETVVYIDNSFSMEAKGSHGPMLKKVTQDLYENLKGDEKISWFTNTTARKNVSFTDFKNEVLTIEYSQNQWQLQDILLKANELFSKSNTADKNLILISDFQQKGNFPSMDSTFAIKAVQTQPLAVANVAIDSAYIIAKNATGIQLKVAVSKTGELPENVAISLFKENQLLAKTAVDFSEKNSNEVIFDIAHATAFNGEISITDIGLHYDNSLFFSINPIQNIHVLTINQSNATFLQKLFDKEGYTYLQQEHDQLNYSIIPSQNFIVLNELKTIPTSLATALSEFSKQGGTLCIIPAQDAALDSYNVLLNNLQIGNVKEDGIASEKKIAKINFSHPLYTNVFEKQVTNFQFPRVQSFFEVTSGASKVLEFEDNKPFLLQKGNSYFVTASIDSQNSNFKTSPLIVPTFINMAQQSVSLPKLYVETGKINTFSVPVKLVQDEILMIKDTISSFIPLQQTKATSVDLITEKDPSRAGNYAISQNTKPLQLLSYNYPREESTLTYANLEDWEGIERFSSVPDVFNFIAQENNTTSFWKWFVIFALLFLFIEMFILKFFK
ncbi:MAG: BatA domain-containing protein [Flavobacteriaceae bacterium]